MSSTSQFEAAVTFCSLRFPLCSQRGLWKKSSHTHGLDIDISDSSLGSLWPNGHSIFFFTERQPCWREEMFTWVSCEQERHTPTMYFSVSEGVASFTMQCYWRLELFFDNGLIFDAAFPCLLVEFVNGVKKHIEKWGGSVKTVNMLLSCRTALLCDWGGCSFDTAATWEVDACEPDSACWKHNTIPHRETPLRICYRYNISHQCRWMGE